MIPSDGTIQLFITDRVSINQMVDDFTSVIKTAIKYTETKHDDDKSPVEIAREALFESGINPSLSLYEASGGKHIRRSLPGFELVKRFSTLTEPDSILSFANEWGCLFDSVSLEEDIYLGGFYDHSESMNFIETHQQTNEKSRMLFMPITDNDYPDLLYGEPLDYWETEIHGIRLAWAIADIIDENTSPTRLRRAKLLINEFRQRLFDNAPSPGQWLQDNLLNGEESLRLHLYGWINSGLANNVISGIVFDNRQCAFIPMPKNLIGYLWYQLARKVAGTPLPRCEVCGTPMLRRRNTKKTCSAKCRKKKQRQT